MPGKNRSIELEANEVALVIGEEDGAMTVRVVPATELPDEVTEIPEPYEIAVALALRLLNDPEFHDEMIEWYESQEEDDDDEDEDEEEEDEDEPKR